MKTFMAVMFSIIACYAVIVCYAYLTILMISMLDDIKKWRNEK